MPKADEGKKGFMWCYEVINDNDPDMTIDQLEGFLKELNKHHYE